MITVYIQVNVDGDRWMKTPHKVREFPSEARAIEYARDIADLVGREVRLSFPGSFKNMHPCELQGHYFPANIKEYESIYHFNH